MTADDMARTGLIGTWVLQPTEQVPQPAGCRITLELRSGAAGGTSGVNRYRGRVGAQARSQAGGEVAGELQFGPLATTLMAGPPVMMAAEHAYLQALSHVDGFHLMGEQLLLLAGTEAVLAFQRAVPTVTC